MVKDEPQTKKEVKNVFTGYAASPGIVQGKAKVIHSPEEFGRFKPGEILVAPTTDPCVVNARGITDVLQDGDLIEVDGKSGTVRIIAEDSNSV